MTTRDILARRNRELAADIALLRDALALAAVPNELRPFQERVVQLCDRLGRQVGQNEANLALGRDEILVDILINTRGVARWLSVVNALFAGPVLRTMASDRLSLILVGWLHQAHPQTARFPPVVADGNCLAGHESEITATDQHLVRSRGARPHQLYSTGHVEGRVECLDGGGVELVNLSDGLRDLKVSIDEVELHLI